MDLQKNSLLPTTPAFLTSVAIAFSIFIMFISVTESFSQKDESTDISVVNSSFVPLTNTDANQVKVNVEYTLEDEKYKIKRKCSNGGLCFQRNIHSNFNCEWIYSSK